MLSKRNIYLFVLGLTASFIYYSLIIDTAHVEVELEVTQDSYLKMYWAEKGQPYSEKNMARAFVYRGCRTYSFLLTDLTDVERLRIDPHEYRGEAKLKAIRIRQDGFVPILIEHVTGFKLLKPLFQIEEQIVDEEGILLVSSGIDPSFEYFPDLEKVLINWFQKILELAFVFVLVVCFFSTCSPLLKRFRFVPVMLFGALVLILIMATLSKRNTHPDEYVHLAAVDYYQDNWLPPSVEDQNIRNTYSVYGVSRLNSPELFYLVAGKFHRALSVFNLDPTYSMRLFSVAMFGLIFLITVKSRCARVVAVPFLVTPQVWYIFSYCNSGAFGLFVTFIVACELVCSGSLFNRYLSTDSKQSLVVSGLYCAGLMACLFLLKKTYYPFILFAGVFALLQILFQEDRSDRVQRFVRVAVISCVGLSLFAGRVGYSYYLDGFERAEKLMVMQEETAKHEFKSSTLLHETIESMYLKEKGESLEMMLNEHQWLKQTFKSGFGIYGYFSITGPNIFYDFVKWVALALITFFVLSVFSRGGLGNTILMFTILAFFMLLLALSLRHSWLVDFQPQGRYLFAIIPMLGLLYERVSDTVDRAALAAGVIMLYGLNAYSFLFYALFRIPKTY